MGSGAESEVLFSPLLFNGKDKILKRMITTQDPRVQEIVKNRLSMLTERREDMKRKISPHRPFSEVMKDGAWAGEKCFIIGGGRSLKGFDFERLRGQGRIIAINRAFEDLPFADICFFMDGSNTTFYGLVKNGQLDSDTRQKWNDFKGHKVYLNLVGRKLDDVYSMRVLGRTGLSNSIKKGIYHGNNSGVGAIGLAICLKANPVYLLGFDCKVTNGNAHYHSGYPRVLPKGTFPGFIKDFNKLGRFIARTKFKVINLNPQSGMRCFPFKTIDEILKGV